MKQIVMLAATFANERGWAKVMSQFGRVTLVQLEGSYFKEHIEIWEGRQCVHSGAERQSVRFRRLFRFLDSMLFGLPLSLTTLKHCWPVVKGQSTDVIIANANSMALTALLLRTIGKTRKVVCLVGDYFPPKGKFPVRVYRHISGFLTRWLVKHADEVWSLSPRIPTIKANPRHFMVPLYIESVHAAANSRTEIGYIGHPSPDHALDILFAICRKHQLRLNVIGHSPYLQSIKQFAPPDTVFYGEMTDYAKINQIFSRCFCGYAVYRNTGPHNYSYYGFPSKTLRFFASDVPVITTDTTHFMQDISKYGIGQVVEPVPEQIEKAVLDLKARFSIYYEAINRFRETWNAEVEKFHRERLTVLLNEE
jgi:glycosyltransferase involved in cell wall biosynthesis